MGKITGPKAKRRCCRGLEEKMEQRILKFRRAYFADGKFSHFSVWGCNIGDAIFIGPGDNNFTDAHIDQQFTGLNDKNGKEVFEGDILAAKFQPHYVERVSWSGPPDAIAEVFWDYNGFRLRAIGENDQRFADFTDFERLEFADEMMVDMATKHSEIIGNVFENPNLLTPTTGEGE